MVDKKRTYNGFFFFIANGKKSPFKYILYFS